MLGFSLLQLVHPLHEGGELHFHGVLDVHLHGHLDGRQVGGGRGSGHGARSVRLEGGDCTELAHLFVQELIPRPTEPLKLVIKVADPPMQGVPLGPSLGQPGVGRPGSAPHWCAGLTGRGSG